MMKIKKKEGRPLTIRPGDRFGMLTVLSREEDGPRRQVRWLCRCDCGNLHIVRGEMLRRGSTKSCGCLRKAVMREASRAAAEIRKAMIQEGQNETEN